jgi:alpha-L-rhamnosidase
MKWFYITLIFSGLLNSCNLSDFRHDQPTGLMVEMLRNPEEAMIEDHEPEFSWIVSSSTNGDMQIAYQVFVSSTKNKAELDQGDLWDSGKIISSESVNVTYGGEPLKPNSSYYWKVRVWYADDKPSSYSDIQMFKTGEFKSSYQTSVMPLLIEPVKPLVIKKNNRGRYFIDFGKDAFGTVRVKIKSQKPDSVIFHLGEKLTAPDSIDREPDGTIRYRRIVLPLKRGNRWYKLNIPQIERHQNPAAIKNAIHIGEITPFRYCEIESCPSELSKESIEKLAVNYYWDDNASSFSSSDSILNKVWELCKYSIKATSFAGIYVDGDRERIPYEADAYINQLGHYCTDREYSMARFSHEYLITHPTWPTEWILHSVLMAYADYLYTGDAESLNFYYNDLKEKTLLRLCREDGLISTQTGLLTDSVLSKIHFKDPIRDIVDWPLNERDGNEMPKVNTVVNAFHYQSLVLMSKIAGGVGNKEDASFFSHQAEKVKQSINQKLYNPVTKLYVDGEGSIHSSLHANIFPLAFGIAENGRSASISKFLVSKGMACSVYAAQYLLEALYLAGEDRAVLELMTATNDRSWWNMIRAGSTITLEAWDIKYKPNLDWNHAWGAVPANMIPRGLWGIEPVEFGFKKVRVKPQTGGLTVSEIKFPTIRGALSGKFETDNRTHFNLQISVPANMEAEIFIPLREIRHPKLYLNNQPVDIKPEKGFFKMEVVSGNYNFTVKGDENDL